MQNRKILKPVMYFLAAGLLVFLISTYGAGKISLEFFHPIAANYFDRLSVFGGFLSVVRNLSNLSNENIRLKEEIDQLRSEITVLESLKKENQFLKEALEIPTEVRADLVVAGVFGIQSLPEGHTLLINKGTNDGVLAGSVIISRSGVVIGLIEEAFEKYSRAIGVTHLEFKTTARILNKETIGIIRGAAADGMILDFISQDEDVSSDDVVVTSGSDSLPAGLIVGRVGSVKNNSGDIFKKIRIDPAAGSIRLGSVLVLVI